MEKALAPRLIVSFFIIQCLVLSSVLVEGQGTWQMLQRNAGVSAMHTAVTRFDTAIMLDRTNIGPSQIRLPGKRCRKQPLERFSKIDCYAHSVMFNPANGAVRPLYVQTDTWCSSGQFMSNGVMVQTGGDFEGNKKIRTLAPCSARGTCDWVETAQELTRGRWYASNHILPGGNRQIVVGGRNEPSYEFVPKRRAGEGAFNLPLLRGSADNLYPFVFLLPNGDFFVFANRDSVILNIGSGRVVKKLPRIPGNPRNYPSAGSAAMLPIKAPHNSVEILVCGGAGYGASRNADKGKPGSFSCGRINPTAANANWAMENMPIRRVMGDMVNLPTGEILIINGAQYGYQGWGKASSPVLQPVTYDGDAKAGKRFQTQRASGVGRVYHSTANLLSDGRVLVAGSNTHQFYTYRGTLPTELRVEAFAPAYLSANLNDCRPRIMEVPAAIGYRQKFNVAFLARSRVGYVEVNILSAPFTTHSYSQGQRAIKLAATVPGKSRGFWVTRVTGPPSSSVAPQQYYMLFCLQNGVPSRANWVRVG
ncbi:aldehyde oxidase GLOX [Physcomitrium patens]|uniref:Galactose oxidase-like Early set domain-containing protein n=1 Tax=Physcomitrium patens TaxID=3218 RepID=A9RYW1_PHYPA|nr:aldehyde oxidase GLOX-like [Physcomitrium patens]PNR41041.1 hypothetical protein PHYPA_018444 [Physcomitrium patens]|eukprot:XP_024395291.1 aldehyde oxidase GLOX-like [Physcomitrella patens]